MSAFPYFVALVCLCVWAAGRANKKTLTRRCKVLQDAAQQYQGCMLAERETADVRALKLQRNANAWRSYALELERKTAGKPTINA